MAIPSSRPRPRPAAQPPAGAPSPAAPAADERPRSALERARQVQIRQGLVDRLTVRPVLWLATAVSILAFAYVFLHGMVLAYDDARSHLNIARRVVDNLIPGLGQLGTGWLPIPQMLMLPLVWIDAAWRTGIAGSIPAMICFVITATYIYRLVMLITFNPFAALGAALLFIANPNMLYLQAVPMPEAVMIMALTGAVLYLMDWLISRTMASLAVAAVLTVLATLSGYEGWLLLLVGSIVVFVLSFFTRAPGEGFRPRQTLGHDFAGTELQYRGMRTEALVLGFAVPGVYGLLLWLFYNQVLFGNALDFATGEYSSFRAQADLPLIAQFRGHLATDVITYMASALLDVGIPLAILAFAGFGVYLVTRRWSLSLPLLLLFTPALFYIYSLFFGQAVMLTPLTEPNGLYNVRYGLLLLPASVVFAAVALPRRWLALPLALLLVALQLGSFWVTGAAVVDEASKGGSAYQSKPFTAWFRQNYDEGQVLVSFASTNPYLLDLGIPLVRTIHEGDRFYWQESIGRSGRGPAQPFKWATWVIMRRDDAVWAALRSQAALQTRYQMLYQSPDGEFEIYRIRGAAVPLRPPSDFQ